MLQRTSLDVNDVDRVRRVGVPLAFEIRLHRLDIHVGKVALPEKLADQGERDRV